MHDFVIVISLFPKESEFITLQNHPMLFITLRLCFKIAISRVFNDILTAIDVFEAAEPLQNDLILLGRLGADGGRATSG